jgi:hypothetical protein
MIQVNNHECQNIEAHNSITPPPPPQQQQHKQTNKQWTATAIDTIPLMYVRIHIMWIVMVRWCM